MPEGAEKTKEQLIAEIAQLRNSLRESQEQEKKYRQIVQNANSIILRMDTGGRITFFNDFAQRFFGWHENELLGRSVIGTILSESDLSGRDLKAMIKNILDNPQVYSANENENIRRNGERVWVAWTNKAIIGEDGSIQEILCVGNDISRFKQ